MFMRYTHFGIGHPAMLRKIVKDALGSEDDVEDLEECSDVQEDDDIGDFEESDNELSSDGEVDEENDEECGDDLEDDNFDDFCF
jgi:hypothetical protein